MASTLSLCNFIPSLSSFSFLPALSLSSLFPLNITTSFISVNNWIKLGIWHMILLLCTYVGGLQAIPLQSVLLGVFLLMCVYAICYIPVSMRGRCSTSHTENVLQQIQALNLAMQQQNQAFDLTMKSVRDENRKVFESAFKSMQDQAFKSTQVQIQAALHKLDMAEAPLMAPRRDKPSPSHEDYRRAELEEEAHHLLNTLNTSGQRPSPPDQAPPAQNPEASQPPLPSGEEPKMASPPHTRHGTHFGRKDHPEAGQFLHAVPMGGLNEQGRPAGHFWSHHPFSVGDLLNWRSSVPPYRQAPKRMANLFASIFVSHRPNWADIQLMLHTLLGLDEQRMVVRRAREEADRLRQQDRQSPEPEIAVPEVDPGWDPNDGGLAMLDLYKKCLLVGLEWGIPKHKNYNKILELEQGASEDPSEFLERIIQTYTDHTDINPDAPQNARLITMTFITNSAPDIRRKLTKVDGVTEMSPSQVVDLAFKVYNNRKNRRPKPATVFVQREHRTGFRGNRNGLVYMNFC
ncbi:uncharacterized protein LOC129146259 [Talpa occidentalis]|uniref:uncharacterized protein LOC129146259 n=1 Tax=Talpa occidentalis TaxID=50954 RepID=UPI0023F83FB1|nr:uncharacterized protein LOC129146259 [Talpa occidentalis]